MINILLNTLNIVLILIAVILVSFGLIVLFIYLHIKSNINSKQIIMNNKLDSIYLVLNEKYRLIKEKVILITDIDKNEKMLESPERMVYSCLDLFPKGIDELMKETELSISELMERLITLELKGYAEEVSRNYYIRLL